MKRILAVFMIAVLLGSFCEVPVRAAEKEPLVLSLEGSIHSFMEVDLNITVDPEIGYIDLTLHYNPEILEEGDSIILGSMPTPHIESSEKGLIHVTMDCMSADIWLKNIYTPQFHIRGAGNPEIYLTEAKVYDKNGNEMPLRIENTFEDAEIVSDITWHYDEDEACLYLGGKGMICSYLYYDVNGTARPVVKTPWHDMGGKAKKVVIQEGVTEVDENTFDGFSQLESIEIADSVVTLPIYMLDDSAMNQNVVLRGKAPGPVELYSNKGFQFEPTNEVLRGDLNDDGQLTAEDALRILQEAAKLEPKHRCTGDYNTDGQVTAEDALGVLRKAAKL